MSKPKSKVAPHVHVADPQIPPDPTDRRDPPARSCRTCGRMSRPGDAHHAMPEPVADAQTRAAGDS